MEGDKVGIVSATTSNSVQIFVLASDVAFYF